MLQLAQTLIFINGNNHHSRLAMLGHGLRFALRRLNDLAESILGILN